MLAEVVVVCLDLVAAEVVGAVSGGSHHAGVCTAEFTQSHVLVLEVVVVEGSNKAIKLFFLVANAMLFDDDVSSKVLEQVVAERVIGAVLNIVLGVNRGSFLLFLVTILQVRH